MFQVNKRRKTKIISKIESTKQQVLKGGQINTVKHLGELSELVKGSNMNKRTYVFLKDNLNEVSANTSKQFDQLNSRTLDRLTKSVKSGVIYDKDEYDSSFDESETKIIECEQLIHQVEREIENLKSNMDDCLGEDKSKWISLNRVKKNKEITLFALRQKYDALVNNNQCIVAAKEITSASEDAAFIENQTNVLDIDTLKVTKQNTDDVFNKTKEQNQELSSLMFDSADISSIEEEYNREIEKKMLEKSESKTAKSGLNSKKQNK